MRLLAIPLLLSLLALIAQARNYNADADVGEYCNDGYPQVIVNSKDNREQVRYVLSSNKINEAEKELIKEEVKEVENDEVEKDEVEKKEIEKDEDSSRSPHSTVVVVVTRKTKKYGLKAKKEDRENERDEDRMEKADYERDERDNKRKRDDDYDSDKRDDDHDSDEADHDDRPKKKLKARRKVNVNYTLHRDPYAFDGHKIIAIYNKHKGVCFSVRRQGSSHRWRLVAEICSKTAQKFYVFSRMTFSFLPAPGNLAYLTWFDPELNRLCARKDDFGTRFYNCDQNSTKYQLKPSRLGHDLFRISNAEKENSCLTIWWQSVVAENSCNNSKDKSFEELFVGEIN